VIQPEIGRVRQARSHLLWLKDESLEDSANLADPDIIAAENLVVRVEWGRI
jgi:hypothetical protein